MGQEARSGEAVVDDAAAGGGSHAASAGPPPSGDSATSDGGASQQAQGWADPDCPSGSDTPLLGYAMNRSTVKPIFVVLTVAGAIACMGIAGVSAWNCRQTTTRMSPVALVLNRSSSSPTEKPTDICLLQVAYGEAFEQVADEITTPNREQYAARHGYRLLRFQSGDIQGLLRQFKCDAKNHRILSIHAVLKYCAVLEAFSDGCDAALWVDGDAVIHSQEVRVQDWMSMKPDADVYWSFSNSVGDCVESHGCADLRGSTGHLLRCINTGAFIMRNTAWSRQLVDGYLNLSVGHNESRLNCTPDVTYFGYSICDKRPDGFFRDQCVFACDVLSHKDNVDHYACLGSNRNMMSYIEFQTQEVSFPQDAYVVNCVDCQGKLPCLRKCLQLGSTTGGRVTSRDENCDDDITGTCLVTMAIGLSYIRMSEVTGITKEHYARKWGYQYIPYVFDSPEESVRWCQQTKFGAQFHEELIAGNPLFKFCTVSHAMMERGCARVIFSDSDALLLNMDEPFHLNWTGAVLGSRRPQVLFGLGQFPHGDAVENGELFKGSAIAPSDSTWCQSDNPCGNFAEFWSCLNTGVFLMENTSEMHQLMARVVHGVTIGTNSRVGSTSSTTPAHSTTARLLRDSHRQGHDIGHMPDHFACVDVQSHPRFQELVTYEWIGDHAHHLHDGTYAIKMVGEHKRKVFMELLKQYHHLKTMYRNAPHGHRFIKSWSLFDPDF